MISVRNAKNGNIDIDFNQKYCLVATVEGFLLEGHIIKIFNTCVLVEVGGEETYHSTNNVYVGDDL